MIRSVSESADQKAHRAADEYVGHPVTPSPRPRDRDGAGKGIGNDGNGDVLAIFTGKHCSHSKRTSGVTRWERVSPAPKASITIIVDGPLPVANLLHREHRDLRMAQGFER